ncbi:MAG: hypothetical protein WHU10_00145 [Fimbriimonadales bacterium]
MGDWFLCQYSSVAREETLVQKTIVDVLKLAGLTVLHTSAFAAKGRLGTAKGVPDLLVHAPDVPLLIIGLEVKTASGRPTPEQKALSEAGMYRIVRSPEDALDAAAEALRLYAPESRFLPRVQSLLAQLARGGARR